MKLLENKTAIITGATRGIGRGIAVMFAQQGANVAFTYSSSVDAAIALENELKELGVHAKGYQSNAAIFDAAQELAADVIKEFGTIDILVNNAGITKDNLAIRMSLEEWNQVLSINLTSCFLLCQQAIKLMVKNKKGSIINISSVVGHTGNAGQVNYTSSKAGIIGMTKSLAREYGKKNIRVNCVSPGFIDTDMTNFLKEEYKKKLFEQIPLARMGNPDDISNIVSFLASDYSSYITGETIHVNGGMYMA